MKSYNLMCLLMLGAFLGATESRALTSDYTYDAAGRLARADYSNGARIDYAYDANGNLIQRTTTGGGDVTYTLIYRAGIGGRIDGVATQSVTAGESGTAVLAVVEDAGAVFGRWSDGYAGHTRTEINVQSHLNVEARFESVGGADLNWYAERGIAPADGEDWSHVDQRIVPQKGTTYRHENIADLDPTNIHSIFRVFAIDPGPPVTVHFVPGSSRRRYRIEHSDDLRADTWIHVPGSGPRLGAGGPDSLTDDRAATGRVYRITVDLP